MCSNRIDQKIMIMEFIMGSGELQKIFVTLNYASLSSSELDDQMFTTLYASLCIGNANFRQIFVKPFGVKFSNEWKGGASCEER